LGSEIKVSGGRNVKIIFGAYLHKKSIDLGHDDPHSVLYISSNTVSHRKCVFFCDITQLLV